MVSGADDRQPSALAGNKPLAKGPRRRRLLAANERAEAVSAAVRRRPPLRSIAGQVLGIVGSRMCEG